MRRPCGESRLRDTQKRVVLSWGVACRAALRKDLASNYGAALCARDRDAAVRGNPPQTAPHSWPRLARIGLG